MDYILTDEKRLEYKKISRQSYLAKKKSLSWNGPKPIHEINTPRLNPSDLMPIMKSNGLRTLSLFSWGGWLDLWFEKAGFDHVGSYEILDICGQTLSHNRPNWNVYSWDLEWDVRRVNWKKYIWKVDVIQGGPPCQPFSVAGQQKGQGDERNMWPEFIKAVNTIKPKAFVAENVPGILNKKFKDFLELEIINQLPDYNITYFKVNSAMFWVPQNRERVFFVWFKYKKHAKKFKIPLPTHDYSHIKKTKECSTIITTKKTMGVREALGLTNIGHDALSPTIRSAFTWKRNTTSILNGKSWQDYWAKLELWPNGVAKDRDAAINFIPENKHRRLSIQDCSILQWFPEDWKFQWAVYKVLWQIWNSVSPPTAYAVAMSLSKALMD